MTAGLAVASLAGPVVLNLVREGLFPHQSAAIESAWPKMLSAATGLDHLPTFATTGTRDDPWGIESGLMAMLPPSATPSEVGAITRDANAFLSKVSVYVTANRGSDPGLVLGNVAISVREAMLLTPSGNEVRDLSSAFLAGSQALETFES